MLLPASSIVPVNVVVIRGVPLLSRHVMFCPFSSPVTAPAPQSPVTCSAFCLNVQSIPPPRSEASSNVKSTTQLPDRSEAATTTTSASPANTAATMVLMARLLRS
jgi:hypothetical protein